MAKMTLTEKRQRAADRKRQQAERAATQDALRGEIIALNVRIDQGVQVILPTAFGPYRVFHVNADMWAYCTPGTGPARSQDPMRSFWLCNDGTWDELLSQAGVPRAPQFARKPRLISASDWNAFDDGLEHWYEAAVNEGKLCQGFGVSIHDDPYYRVTIGDNPQWWQTVTAAARKSVRKEGIA